MKKISEHITYRECIKSELAKRHGINNYFTLDQLPKLQLVANKIFEPVRNHFGVPIFVSSFFRTKELNILLGGAKNSQHCAFNGAAIDVDADVYGGITNKQIFDYIKDNLDFDQLILENVGADGTGGWVHFSYVNETDNRKEVLVMKIINGKQVYEKYKS
jgi:hypothetical protein